jgi:hypothetical protein
VLQESFYAKVRPNRTRSILFLQKIHGYQIRLQSSGININPGRTNSVQYEARTMWANGSKGGKINMWNPLREHERRLHKLYPDLPPKALLVQHLGKNVTGNCDEFQRAQWFWKRRPNKLVLSPDKAVQIGILYILLFFTSVILHDQSIAINVIRCVAWMALAAIGVALFVDITRYAQWKWEYRCAISRFLETI